jgi:parallel beta-helix repeat protein
MTHKYPFLLAFALLPTFLMAQADLEKKIQSQLILAEDGATITLDAGKIQLSKTLSLEGKKNIVIKGSGIDKTILSFKGQTQGAEGIRLSNGETITLEDLTLQDAKGDIVKAMNIKGLTFRNVKAECTGTPNAKNGGYALYPVSCENVLIEGCTAIGASDSGIYVGQSKNVIVRNCKAYHNVAGIEIENTLYAEVYDNEATENTGGILVFDLPDLVQKKGGFCKVYHNNIHDNNYRNFAPKGNIVGKVPSGTGVLLLAANHVEVFENKITNNNTLGTGIISYFITENPITDKGYYPYPTAIEIHDNTYTRENVRPTRKGRMGQLFRFKLRFGKNVPHIIYDGVLDKELLDINGNLKPPYSICIHDNKGETFAKIDAENDFKNIVRDLTGHSCERKALVW